MTEQRREQARERPPQMFLSTSLDEVQRGNGRRSDTLDVYDTAKTRAANEKNEEKK
jgi:hypothetical protein